MGTFDGFVWWCFLGLVGGLMGYTVILFARVVSSIQTLNERIAQIIEKMAWHERELSRHEQRLLKIEEKI